VLYWVMKHAGIGPWLKLVFRPWAEGLLNIPARGPAILASNHLSFSDSFFLPAMVSRQIIFLAKADYFTRPGVAGALTRGFFSGVGQVPIDRSGGSASDDALQAGLRVLAGGSLLGIYPEGTRSPDGRLYRGRTGVARMALEGQVPVIPVAMIGTYEIQPAGQRMPRVARAGMRIGAPLTFERYYGMAGDRYILRSVTDEIMYAVMDLSGQEYVDIYASQAKQLLAQGRRPS